LLRRLRHLLTKSQSPQSAFRIGDRVRITDADPRFADRLGVEAIVASELERGDDGQLYYRLDNNMSARPECLTLLKSAPEGSDGTK
jgi:hypothetical protein